MVVSLLVSACTWMTVLGPSKRVRSTDSQGESAAICPCTGTFPCPPIVMAMVPRWPATSRPKSSACGWTTTSAAIEGGAARAALAAGWLAVWLAAHAAGCRDVARAAGCRGAGRLADLARAGGHFAGPY